MLFSIKKLAVAGLLLLSSANNANSAPAPPPSRAPATKSERVYAVTEQLELQLERYPNGKCKKREHDKRHIKSGTCQYFEHEFQAFKLEIVKDESQAPYWDRSGPCQLHVYSGYYCQADTRVMNIDEINDHNAEVNALHRCNVVPVVAAYAPGRSVWLECANDTLSVNGPEIVGDGGETGNCVDGPCWTPGGPWR